MDRIVCLDCGRSFQALEQHLRMKHGRELADYLADHDLPSDTPLVTPRIRAAAAAEAG